jgi:hypothetical protein
MDRPRLSTRRDPRAPIGPLVLGALLLVALPHALEALDPRLLDLGSSHRGIFAPVRNTAYEAALGVLGVGLGVTALLGIRRWIPRPVVLVLLLAVLLSPFLLRHVNFVERDDPLARFQEKTGFDVVRFHRASTNLIQRVGLALPEDARVALICRRDPEDTPVVLACYLCPRLFYLFFDDTAPDEAVLDREGIGWVLDCRRASYRSDFEGAVLTRRTDR